jgi:hypothetical protein
MKINEANYPPVYVSAYPADEMDEYVAALKARIADLEREISTPVLVATSRLADSLSDARTENISLKAALAELVKAKITGLFEVTIETDINEMAEHAAKCSKVEEIWINARALLGDTNETNK